MYPTFRLIIKNEKGKEVLAYHTTRKRTLLERLTGRSERGIDLKRGYTYDIAVKYSPKYSNSGFYTSVKDAIQAYRAFTEKDLIDDLIN